MVLAIVEYDQGVATQREEYTQKLIKEKMMATTTPNTVLICLPRFPF